MISIDQVLLLEQKVESAVAKIQQLQAENDALRMECEKLTNALSSKSEQLNTYETDQNKIEDGIRKALERLNTIENSVLRAATAQLNNPATVVHTAVVETPVTPTEKVESPVSTPNPDTNPANHLIQHEFGAFDSEFGAFDSMQEVPSSTPVNPQPVKPAPVPFTEDIPDPEDFAAEETEEESLFEPSVTEEYSEEPEITDGFSLEENSPIDSIFDQAEMDAFEDTEVEPEDEVSEDFPENNSKDLGFDIF